MRNFYRLFLLGLGIIFSSPAIWANLVQYTFQFRDEKYSVWVMNGDKLPSKAVPTDQKEFQVRKAAMDLAQKEYAALGFTNSPDLQELLMASRTLVVISELNNPENPYQIVSIAKGREIPIARRMHANGLGFDSFSGPTIEDAQSFRLNQSGETSHIRRANVARSFTVRRGMGSAFFSKPISQHIELQDQVAVMGSLELKSLVKSGESPRGFTPLLSHVVNSHDLFLHTGIPVNEEFKDYGRSHLQSSGYQTGSYGAHFFRPYVDYGVDPLTGKENPFKNKEFYYRDIVAVSFRPLTHRYFQRNMGFDPILAWEDPSRNGELTLVLRRSIKDFLERNHLSFMGSREGEILSEGILTHEHSYESIDWSKYPDSPDLTVHYSPVPGGGESKCQMLFDSRRDNHPFWELMSQRGYQKNE